MLGESIRGAHIHSTAPFGAIDTPAQGEVIAGASYPNFGWALMKQQPNIKTVRIEIEPDKVSQAQNWIAQAKANGYAIIATYHKSSVLGTDDTAELTAAANWWKTNYGALGGGFTINLMNEWGSHSLSANSYAVAYNSAIATVRQVYSGPIIIDCPGYGQETATTAAAVKGYNSTPIYDTNIVLAMHVYPDAFVGLKDLTLTRSYAETGWLWDDVAPLSDVLPTVADLDRIWLLQYAGSGQSRRGTDVQTLTLQGFHVAETTLLNRTRIIEMTR